MESCVTTLHTYTLRLTCCGSCYRTLELRLSRALVVIVASFCVAFGEPQEPTIPNAELEVPEMEAPELPEEEIQGVNMNFAWPFSMSTPNTTVPTEPKVDLKMPDISMPSVTTTVPNIHVKQSEPPTLYSSRGVGKITAVLSPSNWGAGMQVTQTQ